MSKTDKNIAKQALLEMDEIKKSIKEESKETLKALLSEAVKDAIRNSVEDDDEDSDEYEIENNTDGADEKDDKSTGDVSEANETDVNDADAQEEPMVQTDAEVPAQTEEEPAAEQPQEEGDDWSEFSQYQTGDENTYDLTSVQDYDQIVKVYKLMKDDDQVVVKQDGNTISLSDNETGNEYVIDLGMDGDNAIKGESEEQDIEEGVIKEDDSDIAGIPDDMDEFEEENLDDAENNEPKFEGKKSKKVMKENKEMLFEIDLGYTDNYQDKDPIQGLSNAEPSKSGKSWEKGVPTGTEKPWAGDSKSKGEPFEKTVNEEDDANLEECGAAMAEEDTVDEAAMSRSRQADRKETKSNKPSNAELPKVSKNVSVAGDYKAIAEAYKKENKELKESVKDLKKTLKEAYVVNTNLAKITRLFTENTVSQSEKKEIVNRFVNEAKTIEQSNALYESIDKQLKSKQLTLESSKPMTVENKTVVNESKTTYKSQDLLNTLDLIKRMNNC